MVLRTSVLNFETTDRNLWAPGDAIELGIDTGDLLIFDPPEASYDIDIGGSFLGFEAEVYFDAKFGLLAYATLGEAGRFSGGIDIAVNVEHDAVAQAAAPIQFDFSDYSILGNSLSSQGFGLGAEAGIDFVIGAEFGFRDIKAAVFGFDIEADAFEIVDVPEKRIPLFQVTPLDTELPFDLGYGLELTLRVPTGADTEGSSNTSLVATAEGISDTRFIELSADVDELILTLLQKVPFPPLAAVAKTLENTVFATFEFDINDYVPVIDEGIFSVEATLVDIGASIGASISEEIQLDFGDGTAAPAPDVSIALRSDNGTPDDLSDDKVQIAKLGDANVTIQQPSWAGSGPVTVDATYSLNRAQFTHSLGVDITGEFTIDILQASTSGFIGEKLGINIGPVLALEFPEGGFRFNAIPELYGNSFEVAGSDFNTVQDSFEIYYSEFVPAGIDLTQPGQVQELIAFNEARLINVAASATAFSGITGGLPTMGYDSHLAETTNITGTAEQFLYQFQSSVANIDFDSGADFEDLDVIGIDGRNVTGAGGATLQGDLEVAYFGGSFNGSVGSFIDEFNSASINFLREHHVLSDLVDTNFDGNVDDGFTAGDNDNYIVYKFNADDPFVWDPTVRIDGAVNVVGGDGDDVLLYVGKGGRLFDGGGQGTSDEDTFIANFAKTHANDKIEWDLRSTAPGQSGESIVLKLSGDALFENTADVLLDQVNAGVIYVTDLPTDTKSVLRIFIEPTDDLVEFEVFINGTLLEVEVDGQQRSRFSTSETDGINADGLQEIVIKDIPGAATLIDTIVIRNVALEAGDTTVNPVEISAVEVHRQHEVNLIEIERFSIATGDKNDYIATAGFQDLIDLGAGDDTLLLTHDNQAEFMYLGDGADIAVVELKTGGGRDFVYGGRGADEAVIRNIDTSTGIVWQIDTEVDPSSYAAGPVSVSTGSLASRTLDTAASSFDLQRAVFAVTYLFENEGYGTTADESLFEDNKILAGLSSTSSVELYGFEAVSFEGSDGAGDLAIYMGGSFYQGGDDDGDTFAAHFGLFEDQSNSEGILLNASASSSFPMVPGYYETELGKTFFADGDGVLNNQSTPSTRDAAIFANGQQQRTVTIDGFERLVIFRATEFDDILVGGDYVDYLSGDGGNDILVAGGSSQSIDGILISDDENKLFGGDGEDTFYASGDAKTSINGDALTQFQDRLIFDAGSLTSSTAIGLVHDLTGSTLRASDSTAVLLQAMDDLSLVFSRRLSFDDFTNGYVTINSVEATNLTGLSGTDDLFLYDGGATYIGGDGDMDTFVADFSTSQFGITYSVATDADTDTRLSNGVSISGMDRLIIKLGAGNDIVAGGIHDDYIAGGDGADNLAGGGSGAAGDRIEAGAGADFIAWSANEGLVSLDGGSDVGDTNNEVEDRLVVSAIDALGQALDTTGLGFRIQDISGGTFTGDVSTRRDATSSLTDIEKIVSRMHLADTFTVTSGSNEIEYTNIEALDVQGSNAHDDLIIYQNGVYYDGGDRDGDADTFGARLIDETDDLEIIARRGNDLLNQEDVFRDIGNGTTIGNFERLLILSGEGDDLLVGGDFDDSLDGGLGDDILDGGLGDDFLRGGLGEDILFFSGGNDLIIGGNTFGATPENDTLEMGAVAGGYDFIQGWNGLGLVDTVTRADLTSIGDIQTEFATFFANLPNIFFVHQGHLSGTDRVEYREIEKVVISAEEDDDLLLSGQVGGVLSGDGGQDTLVGLDGDDLLIGGSGFDRYVLGNAWGDDIIGGEFTGSGEIYFIGWDQSEITFSLDASGLDMDDLIATNTNGDTLRFIDYFVGGTNGLDYTFVFDDITTTLNLTGLGATPKPAPVIGLTLVGTDERDEFLETTAGPDAYFAGAGSDLIRSSEGADILSGGLGLDAVFYEDTPILDATDFGIEVDLATGFGSRGYAEGDLLISIEDVLGTGGRDIINGSDVRNALAGGAGDDSLSGRGGNDVLTGDIGDDTVDGGAGHDTLFGGAGADSLLGGAGADTISGGDGNDTIFGNDGDDAAAGGAGDDTADMGAGNDRYAIATDDAGTAPGHDTVNGGADEDTIDLSDFDARVTVSLFANTVITTFENDDTPAGPFQTIATLSNFENAVGSRYADGLFGDAGNNKLNGQAGDDLLQGNEGADILIGGGGIDRVSYANESGTGTIFVDLATGLATDSFGDSDTLSEIEWIIGGDAQAYDDLYGDASSNRFTGNGGTGVDLIDGREGSDWVDYGAENTQNYLPGSFTPGAVGVGIVVDLSLAGSLANPNATDTRGHGDWLINIENVSGSIRDDSIIGNDADNTFVGGDGNDTLDGRGGFDTVDYSLEGTGPFGVAGPNQSITIDDATPANNRDTFGDTDVLIDIERIIATDFDDSIKRFADARHVIEGNAGDDLIELIDGPGVAVSGSQLGGGAGNDTLIGNTGNDIFLGGFGDDSAFGGAGDDLYLYVGGADDFQGQTGSDELSFAAFGAAVTVFLPTGLAESNGTTSWEGGTQSTLLTMGSIENVTGSEFDDFLVSSPFDGTLRGGGGNDVILLSGGAQTVFGGDGVDELRFGDFALQGIYIDLSAPGLNLVDMFGASGSVSGIEVVVGTALDDTFIGGATAATFIGGDGADTFTGGDGFNTIDYARESGGGNVIMANFFDAATGRNFGFIQDTYGNIDGFAGIDHFIGGNGAGDTLVGSDADETFTGAAGNLGDSIDGGAGTDTLDYSPETGGQGVVVDLGITAAPGTPNATDTYGHDDYLTNIENVIGSIWNDQIIGSAALLNVLGGGDGDDTLTGGFGFDTLNGGAGFDTADYTLETGTFGIFLDLQAGFALDTFGFVDTLEQIERVIGSVSNDNLAGSTGDDVLEGAAGNDIMIGLEGNDNLIGGAGNDEAYGLQGRDTLSGGTGNDTLSGGADDDLIEGGAGADSLMGGTGSDTVSYAGSDVGVVVDLGTQTAFSGHAGGDVLSGFENAMGSDLDDQLIGDTDRNALIGRAGTDFLTGFGGRDSLFGSDGNDFLRAGDASSDAQTGEIYDGGDGNDTLLIRGIGNQVLNFRGADVLSIENLFFETQPGPNEGDRTVQFNAGQFIAAGIGGLFGSRVGGESFRLEIFLKDQSTLDLSALNTFIFTGATDVVQINGTNGGDNIVGSQAQDEIFGNGGGDTVRSGNGNDTINGGSGNDRLIGAAGHDSLLGGVGLDTLNGGEGDDTLIAGDGDDRVYAEAGNDSIDGGSGNDLLEGKIGNDTILGGAGNDTLRGSDGSDRIIGGDGDDVAFGGNDNDTIDGGAGNDTLDGSGGNDLIFGGAGDDVLVGETGADTLDGGAGNDTLRGSGGNDLLTGGDGNDLMFGSSLEDTLFGGAGNDVLDGNQQADQLFGEAGNDTLRGDDGFDALDGGAGDDVLVGGNGNDTLTGAAGQDTLRGLSGADQFIFDDVTESAFGLADLIDGIDGVGALGGDLIDLSGIDADTTALGNQAFTFIGSATTAQGLAGGAGTLWTEQVGGQTRIYGLTDADANIDLAIRINDGTVLASDYIATDFVL